MTGRVLVHPFDDPRTLAGQGTVALEILEDVPEVDTIVVPCGGGGLVSGIASVAVPSGVRVVAVEPERSRALHDALRAGGPVPVETDSIADGLAAPFAGRLAVETCAALGVESILVSDEEIEAAFRSLYADAKLACEPAGAAAVAAVQSGKVLGERIVCVVSGGNVSPQIATAILAFR
jgi:threonine dehydratase